MLHRRRLADRPGPPAPSPRVAGGALRGDSRRWRCERPLPGGRRSTSFVARRDRCDRVPSRPMTSAPRDRRTVHVVPHTHWDREWYRPFQSFRMRLVDCVDTVLDMMDADPRFAFTLDGQLATVDDYLEIR